MPCSLKSLEGACQNYLSRLNLEKPETEKVSLQEVSGYIFRNLS